jgi:hypothetical protein
MCGICCDKALWRWLILGMVLAGGIMLPYRAAAGADEASVKRRIGSLEEDAKAGNWGRMQGDLEISEEQIKELPEASRAPLLKRLEPLKKGYADAMAKVVHENSIHSIKALIDSAKSYASRDRTDTDDLDRAQRMMDQYKDRLTDADRKELGDEIASLKKQFGQIKLKSDLDRVAGDLDSAEKKFAELSKRMTDPEATQGSDVGYLADSINRVLERLKAMPQDDTKVKELTARAQKLDTSFDQAANTGKRSRMLAQAKREWDGTIGSIKGWETEQAPSYQEWIKQSTEVLPKTSDALRKTRQWEDYDSTKQMTKTLGSDPEVKKMVDEAAKIEQAAKDKISKAIDALVTAGEKAPSKEAHDRFQYFQNNIERLLAEGPEREKFIARTKGIVKSWDDKMAGEEKGREEAYAKAVDQAQAAWPAISAKVSASDGISPAEVLKNLDAYKGKVVRLKDADNRARWELGGGYDFAEKIDGIPVAGYFSEGVKKAIHDSPELPERVGFPESHLDILARIDGECRVQESQYSQILQKWIPEFDHRAVKVTVVGFHGGAVAAADGAGSVTSSASGASSGSRGAMGWLMSIIGLLVGLTAAAVVVLKARPELATQGAVAAGPAGANAVAQVSKSLDTVGLGIAAFGVLWLLMSAWVGGILAALAVTLCGFFVASDFLKSKGVPEATLNSMKPLGIILAGGTALLVLIHVVVGGIVF